MILDRINIWNKGVVGAAMIYSGCSGGVSREVVCSADMVPAQIHLRHGLNCQRRKEGAARDGGVPPSAGAVTSPSSRFRPSAMVTGGFTVIGVMHRWVVEVMAAMERSCFLLVGWVRPDLFRSIDCWWQGRGGVAAREI